MDELKGWQVESCRGPQGCPNRAAADDGLAGAVADLFERRGFGAALAAMVGGPIRHRHEFRVAIADCPNACSRPQIADVGLIGAARPRITNHVCHQCMGCVHACQEGAVSHPGLLPVIDHARCVGCGLCSRVCLSGTIQVAQRGYRVVVGGKLGRHPRLAEELPGLYGREGALAAVECAIDHYLANAQRGERLGAVLERTGSGGIAACLRERAVPAPSEPGKRVAPILRGPV